MKAYADRKQYVKEHDVCVDDIVLAPQKREINLPPLIEKRNMS